MGEIPIKRDGVTYSHVGHSDDADFQEKVKKLLLFHRVVNAEKLGYQEGVLTLDNGVKLFLQGNEGCGGCSNGWYYLEQLNTCDNAITNVECVLDGDSEDGTYHIYVYADAIKVNLAEYEGSDNGWYGTGYDLYVSGLSIPDIARNRWVILRDGKDIFCGLARHYTFKPINEVGDTAIKTYLSEAKAIASFNASWYDAYDGVRYQAVPVKETLSFVTP